MSLRTHVLLAVTLSFATLAPAAPVLAAAAPDNREVIVLVRTADGTLTRGEDSHTTVEAVLNHLGLIAHFHDLHDGLPDDALAARARGVVCLVQGAGTEDPAALAGWLARRERAGCPVALLAGADFLKEALDGEGSPEAAWTPVLDGLGVRLDPESIAGAESPLVWTDSAWPPFEAAQREAPAAWVPIHRVDEACETILGMRHAEGGDPADAVVLGPKGVFVSRLDAILAMNPITFRMRWRLDPVRLLGRALRLGHTPALDVTTVNGRRAFFAHVDGDGFSNLAVEPLTRPAAEVLRDEVLAHTWVPTTVSVVAREMVGHPEREALARSLFALPAVLPASHSWTHPHDWQKGIGTPEGAVSDWAGSLANGKPGVLSPTREVDNSIRYVQSLAPKGKKAELMLWSGETNPTEAFLARTEALGVANMNGGDATLAPGAPSMAAVAPLFRRVGGYVQPYAACANENLFTNNWTGPYDGQLGALDFWATTGTPTRFTAVNLYYHFYQAERLAGVKTLRTLYAWAERQPFAFLTAAGYARTVAGFAQAGLTADGPDAWRVSHAGACRTLRLDQADRLPDLAASRGIAGYRVEGERVYVHLAAPDARLVLAARPASQPRLEEASAPLVGWRRDGRAITAIFDAAAPATVVLAGLPQEAPVRVAGGFKGDWHSDRAGRLTLTAPAGVTRLEVRW